MYKERIIGQNTGIAPDLKWWNSGGDSSTPLSTYTADKLRRAFWMGYPLRSTVLAGSVFKGTEFIRSTSRGRTRFNDCDHWRCSAINLPYSFAWQGTYRPGQYAYYRTAFPSGTMYQTKLLPIVKYGDGPRARAWWHMQPRFLGEVQMLNFLFELKDFKDLSRLISHPSDPLKLWKGLLHPMSNRRAQRDLAKAKTSPSTALAKAHLMYQFAIKPLIKDIAAIGAQIASTAAEKQKEFLGNGREPQTSHYTEVLDSQLTTWGNGKLFTTSKFTATMQYLYKYRMRNTLEAFARYWGLTGSAEAFWNAIPASFIADYFATISKSIHAMTTDPNVDLQLLQYCESSLNSEEWGAFAEGGILGQSRFLVNGNTYVENGSPRVLISGYKATRYVRHVCSPYRGPALPKLKLPSSAQRLNLLALARCFL